ncbi:hypothetical protein LINGRAHAP2_LOCUS1108 [Linum grandiflorum]
MPSFHLPNFLKSCPPFLYGSGVMFLTMFFKCILVRTSLMSDISRVHEIENGQYDVPLSFPATLNHLS